MSDDFLSRWSRRKIAVRKGEKLEEAPKEPSAPPPTPEAARAAPTAGGVPEPADTLPPVESLTSESDFSAFMKPEVDPATRREALKVLMRDERFNVMDGLDVYIDDYSKPDPLPVEWLEKLNQTKHFGHYIEKVLDSAGETAADATEQGAQPSVELQKAIAEQPVEPSAPDTNGLQNPDLPVGESGGARK